MGKRLPSNTLSRRDLAALRWAIDNAEDWRGSLIGHPDPNVVPEFDAQIAEARAALAKVKHMTEQLKSLQEKLNDVH